MNTVTSIFTAILLGAAIGYGSSTATTDQTNYIEPPPTYETGDTVEAGGPPPTYDGGDTPVCLGCD